ncbi:DUF3152 domain-containing protein [Spirilliplanes yamanashiensis]|uniref:DUF3152 domain-containing protein n=1 Tax=Spirilliplanes yamanashiensis TaxID=42233 RepID=A0A8J3Y8N6_9ACTN|nr:DUF3152 domain-containing protein [Spirilliplanes yamanashiensis]MDP9815787.1 hypothetical protein [Spirilliplanes yamanashiensis]GIJ04041.1 hypothetical protein Sya03_33930 [Spirilliplanes yamanashiensis]
MNADARPRPGQSRRSPAALMAVALLGVAGTALAMARPDPAPPPAFVAAAPSPPPSAVPAAAPSAPSAASPGPDLTRVLRLPGEPPATGSGRFRTAPGGGPLLGRSGMLRTFRVAVERGSGEGTGAFAATVDEVLGDPRSWAGNGDVRLRRVGPGERADFTVYLATRTTAGRMCAAGGTNITVGGRPYTSCRATGRVIINLDRWRLSSPRFTEARIPLGTYRAYVLNHEVGHELGHRHEGCPRRGRPAPVMVQQTLKLMGCTPYAWPRRDGRPWTGPRL